MDYPWQEADWYEEDEAEAYYAEYEWDTQAVSYEPSGGCLLGLLPLAAVILVSFLLAFLAFNWTSPAVAISISRAVAQDTNAQQAAAPQQKEPQQTVAVNHSSLAPLFTPQIQYWTDLIIQISTEFDLDPNLVATVMQIESCGDPMALSSAGARGLFQVMPYHFAAGEDPHDPQTNALRGISYLSQALEARQGDARLALASYNGGINGASRPESQWAAETKRYAYWGEGIYQDAVKGKKKSSRLQEWLNAGGAGLCQQASQRLGIKP